MPPIPTSTSLDGFQCASGEEQRKACTGEPGFADSEGKSYCVLHYPAKNKLLEFKEAIDRKINAEEFNFRGVWFPEKTSFTQPFTKDVNFAEAVFSDEADFSYLDFRNKADFSKTTFQGTATFNDARFCDLANFVGAKFLKNAHFINTTFKKKADFGYSEFFLEANFDTYFDSNADFVYVFFRGEAYFRYAIFNGLVNFRSATFKDYLRFGGEPFSEDAEFDFQHARIDNPERVAFYSLKLRPHWFVNVNARKFDFVDVDWNWKVLSIEAELAALQSRNVTSAHRLLAITFRNLAFNAQENEQFEDASRFRYLASELWRKNEPHDRLTSFLGWLYWAGSGYGERIGRACMVLVGVWLLFALLYARGTQYTKVGFGTETVQTSPAFGDKETSPPASLSPMKSLIYSLNTMTLQKPEPKPITSTAKVLVLIETIVGPIQTALLLLAIRRKFMR
jgi:uncharacterized protein YjbI with pentapeptide repeats